MSECQNTPIHEMQHYLESLDKQMAALQYQAHFAYKYALWCEAHFAELDTRRRELADLINEWVSYPSLDHHARYDHDLATTLSR